MTKTLILSDVHLSTNPNHSINQQFHHFLQHNASHYCQIYILGDLFDRWLGDDIGLIEYSKTIDLLQNICAQGTPIYLMVGNRDFLLGRCFFSATGVQPLPDYHRIQLHGHRYLMTHGDLLCLEDTGYLRMRTLFHHPVIQWLFLCLPQKHRQSLGAKIQKETKQATQNKRMETMDVSEAYVQALLQEYECPTLIHGHTHQPDIHLYQAGEKQRYVLGDWGQNTVYFEASKLGLLAKPMPFSED